MNPIPSHLLIRAESTLRLISTLEDSQHEALAFQRGELQLMVRLLTAIVDDPTTVCEHHVLMTLSDTLQEALDAISSTLSGEGEL